MRLFENNDQSDTALPGYNAALEIYVDSVT